MYNDVFRPLPPLSQELEALIDKKVHIDEKYSLPKNVQYCKRCVISNQRPRIGFVDGVCNACRYWESKDNSIDWNEREARLQEVCNKHRRNDGRFDVLVPSSGGKDSVYVAHILKEKYGMNPLTMTWAPHVYTEIGFRNLQAKIHSGFNNILLFPDGYTHRLMTRLSTILIGDPFQPFIYGQSYLPLKIAAAYGIDLIFDGENGEAEYGGDASVENAIGFCADDADEYWLSGFPIDEWKNHGFSEKDLNMYMPPSSEELERCKGIERHFASYYLNWQPQKHYFYCAEHTNFLANPEGRSEGTFSKYASLDDQIDPYHYYFALLKFGISRCTSDAAHEIREHLIDRDEGVALVHKYDTEYPSEKTKNTFLEYCGLTPSQLARIENRWRNERLWNNDNGVWKLNGQVGF
ncbi:N-acetyl sugar amidotransferase [Aliamphritea hakodatensis]|uniref:N-acetyl sugar amidotransferase n=1 Tax=Aliamphritea hakodatensis TaxID=2895352 RepID=UPI0022FD4EE5|nr:N-acetyl sugar amidotransferase [Aliamphritea hakodatensis]